MPGLLFPTPGGPRTDEVLTAVRAVLETGRVTALSVGCTWAPDEESDGDGGGRARLLTALLEASARRHRSPRGRSADHAPAPDGAEPFRDGRPTEEPVNVAYPGRDDFRA
ncbi:hypothetical protein ACWFMI_19725 [Nocardiopsis terrae]